MKVSTNPTSGNMMDLVRQAETALVEQAGSLFSTAEQQAAGLTSTVANMAHNLWQGLTG
jgi:hypothetical protein